MKALSLVMVGIITGCAASAEVQQWQSQINATIPVCNENIPNQCDRMWETAQVWVAQNSAFRMQIVTNVLLETFGPPANDPNIAVRVIKEPTSNTSYRFLVTVYCNNIFGCNPNQYLAAIDFNNTLNAVN